jgi:hypothetical protein
MDRNAQVAFQPFEVENARQKRRLAVGKFELILDYKKRIKQLNLSMMGRMLLVNDSMFTFFHKPQTNLLVGSGPTSVYLPSQTFFFSRNKNLIIVWA